MMKRWVAERRNAAKRTLRSLAYQAPFRMMIWVFRLLYRFRVEGMENIPAQGPLLMVLREPGLIGLSVVGWITILVRLKVLGEHREKSVAYMQDYLFALGPFRRLRQTPERGRFSALPTHSAGRMVVSLLDGYQALRDGGIVSLNPYGEWSWDGRPPPQGWSAAWLALRTAAPVMPTVCSIGAYDIWPRWQLGPSRRGRVTLKIGAPFRVCDTPCQQVTNEDLEGAKARIGAEVESLCFGPGGVEEWMGPVTRDGVAVAEPVEVRLAGGLPGQRGATPLPKPLRATDSRPVPVRKRGMAQLLWRCPVCGSDDALVEVRRRFRPLGLRCQACETRWQVRRILERDFQLKVIEGPPHVVGLEMALSRWHDEMMKGFRLTPTEVSGLQLLPDERAYAEMEGASLRAERTSALFEGPSGREPPQGLPPGQPGMTEWVSLGKGRLVLTSHRLVWQGLEGELDFHWASVTAVYLWIVNSLGLVYGQARYRLDLGYGVGPQWLAYANALLQQAAEREGRAAPEAR